MGAGVVVVFGVGMGWWDMVVGVLGVWVEESFCSVFGGLEVGVVSAAALVVAAAAAVVEVVEDRWCEVISTRAFGNGFSGSLILVSGEGEQSKNREREVRR